MTFLVKYISLLGLVFNISFALAQKKNEVATAGKTISLQGTVIETITYQPIADVNIETSGGAYTATNARGEFKIETKKGEELIIRHKDFETIYRTINHSEPITIEMLPNKVMATSAKAIFTSRAPTQAFNSLLDSAEFYLKKDAKKSIEFIAEALKNSRTVKENSEAYQLLGDIYTYWKQYDLAVSNYRLSIQNTTNHAVKIKLAKAYQLNKNYQESLATYNAINKNELSNWQLITVFEGIGDVHQNTKSFEASLQAYGEGLKVAEKHLITPKVTDLNSKIAQVYDAKGEFDKAKGYFNESLKLAKTQNKKRGLEEKIKVADFQNNLSDYSSEIQLRKEALKAINEIEDDSVFENESALTPQQQNYKIGNAYALQKDYEQAITYLKRSINEADGKEDLLVQKDATRKLSEVLRDAGEFDKALLAYQNYVDLVDKVYSKKEKDITQAIQFSKDIAAKQNRILSLESERALSESKYQLSTEQAKRQKLIIYSLIAGVLLLLILAFLMFKSIKQQRLANNLLALKTLRTQMNPHFIFNALNSVNSFIASNDERAANRYLTDFSLLMRAVLENSENDFIPLEKEIELLELYTKLEHFRFKNKFDYNITVDKNVVVNDFVIPPMLLQPYVENAVWHGLRYKKTKGHLNITIVQTASDEIKITISDDGIGRENSKALKTEHQQKQNSKGLGNIKKRVLILNSMYKDKVDVFIDDLQKGVDPGTKVEVTLKKFKKSF
ncbi:sensor histidine kinase [Oceanihabitans sp. IOP_32]|uniref:histidine kinase n=1 Tax=Oceanihabitans sp. IOP_32 TaxID=2529032 RepID=UPI00129301B2|nr:histidine kinase [Oceanihabitans sp. IOP_32]QFZ54046.1 sensor histidine kinase [Oceanihabitans sp. IOP_32]